MSRIILHDYFRSSASYRVRIALNLKGLDYEQHQVNLLKGEQKSFEHHQLNWQGFVPVLEIDDLRLTQSLAIIEYLDARYPEPRLVPEDPAAAATVRALAMIVACDIHPLNNLRVLNYIEDYFSHDIGVAGMNKGAWAKTWIMEGFKALNAMARPHAGAFLFGDTVTLADICLVPQLFNARRFDVPLDAYQSLLRAEASALELAAFQKAHPDAQEVRS